MKRSSAQKGYSLVEALVVVAIVGLVSLVTVPNFITMYRSSKFKSSLRQFTSDIRSARQHAVSINRTTRVSFEAGDGKRTYEIAETTGQDLSTATWTTIEENTMEETVFFHSAPGITNVDNSADGTLDLVFKNDGTIIQEGDVILRTTDQIPYNQFTVDISPVGKLSTTKEKY